MTFIIQMEMPDYNHEPSKEVAVALRVIANDNRDTKNIIIIKDPFAPIIPHHDHFVLIYIPI